jgi:hypothetical protein
VLVSANLSSNRQQTNILPYVIVHILAKLLIILQKDKWIFALHGFAIGRLVFLLLRWHVCTNFSAVVEIAKW